MALLYCPKCHQEISNAEHFCPTCGMEIGPSSYYREEVNNSINFCPNCGGEITKYLTFKNNNIINFCPHCGGNINKSSMQPSTTHTRNYTLIAIGILFIVIAILLVTTNKFIYHVDHLDFYNKEYKNAKAHSSGYLGIHYSTLASRWKQLINEAIIYIISHIIGAIGFSIGGTICLYKGFKKLRNGGNTNHVTN